MKKIFIFIFLLIITQSTFSQAVNDLFKNSTDSIFKKHLNAREYLTGGVISIVNADSIIFSEGYGLANRENKIPFSPNNTTVQIASVTKLITTTALLQLVESGEIDLDKPIDYYLKDLSYKNPFKNKVLVNHLLTHIAGFDDRSNFMESKTMNDIPTLKEYAESYIPSVIWEPGKYFNYSNYSFLLGAYLVATVSGITYEQYVKNNLLIPLEMNNSGFGYEPRVLNNLMERYRLRENQENEIYTQKADTKYTNLLGVTGFKTTALDMANFMMMYLNNGVFKGNRILKKETIDEAFKTHFTYDDSMHYQQGLGWRILIKNGIKVMYHYGDDTGVESSLVLFPDKKIGLFTAFNNPVGYNVKTEVQEAIFNKLYGLKEKPKVKYVPIESIDKITGDYFYMNDSHTTFEKIGFLLGDRKISIESQGDSILEIGNRSYYNSGNPLIFNQVEGDSQIKFITDENGNISNYSYGTSTYRKIKGWEDPSIHQKILLVSIIVFVLIFLTSLIRFIISKFKKKPQINKSSALKFINLNGLLIILFFVGIGIATKSISLDFGVPLGLKAVFIFPVLAVVLVPFSIYYLFKELQKPNIPVWLKGLMVIDIIAITLCLMILNNYNIIGFNFI